MAQRDGGVGAGWKGWGVPEMGKNGCSKAWMFDQGGCFELQRRYSSRRHRWNKAADYCSFQGLEWDAKAKCSSKNLLEPGSDWVRNRVSNCAFQVFKESVR